MEILKIFKQFKLGSTLFKSSWRIENYKVDSLSSEIVERESIIRLTDELSSFIINNHKSVIKKENREFSVIPEPVTEYTIELMVLKLSDFKAVVDAAIGMIPMSIIEKIKKGEEYNNL